MQSSSNSQWLAIVFHSDTHLIDLILNSTAPENIYLFLVSHFLRHVCWVKVGGLITKTAYRYVCYISMSNTIINTYQAQCIFCRRSEIMDVWCKKLVLPCVKTLAPCFLNIPFCVMSALSWALSTLHRIESACKIK